MTSYLFMTPPDPGQHSHRLSLIKGRLNMVVNVIVCHSLVTALIAMDLIKISQTPRQP